jgi:thiol-disulfide isomerase/thioredoxin
VDWPSLKGKTVILEFWATWRGPCVASIPHLNQLAASLDPHKFVFISIDDEDAAVVEAFLHKRKMAGWVGLNPNAATFRAFGVDARPAAIVADRFGKIASVTTSDKLTEENLVTIASKGPSANKGSSSPAPKALSKAGNSATKSQGVTTPAPQSDPDPLFELSIRPSTRRQNGFAMMHSTDGKRWGYIGVDSMFLLSHAYSIPSDRIKFEDGQPGDRYDFSADRGDLDPDAFSRIMQTVIPSALGLRVTEETIPQPVLVLHLTGDSLKPCKRQILPKPHT